MFLFNFKKFSSKYFELKKLTKKYLTLEENIEFLSESIKDYANNYGIDLNDINYVKFNTFLYWCFEKRYSMQDELERTKKQIRELIG